MKYNISLFLVVLIVCFTICPQSKAETLSDLEVHGFLSQGFIKTTDNNYLAQSKLGSFDFTDTAINFTRPLTNNLRTGVQLFARKLGATGGFDARVDWFFFDYRPTDFFGFRFGRIKIPFGLYNDSSDADSGRATILLPQSIYPSQNRDFLLAQSGMEIYGYTGASSLGSLEYRLYGGTISLDVINLPGSAIRIRDLNVPYVAGSRIMWEPPIEGLRLGGSVQVIRLDTTLIANSSIITGQVGALLWVSSAEYTVGDLQMAAEYSQWTVKTGNGNISLLYPETTSVSERAYLMASYRLSNWIEPALYFSHLVPNISNRVGPGQKQQDLSATVRFDINPFWLVKLEGHYMLGTAGLIPAINDNTAVKDLADSWAAFLIRTTVYF